jgi:WD40 repeat protein
VRLAALSAEGRRVVVVTEENSLRLMDAGTGQTQLLARPRGSEGAVEQVRWSPAGSWVLTGTRDYVRVWDAASGSAVTPPLWQSGPVLAAAFTAPRRLTIQDADGLLEVWELPGQTAVSARAGEEARALRQPGPARAPGDVQLTDGRIIRADAPATAARLPRWRPARVIERAAFSADGSRVAIAAGDRAIQVWDAKNGQPLTPPLLHTESLAEVGFPAGADVVVVVGTGGAVRRWELTPDRRPPRQLRMLAQALSGQALDSNGRLVVRKRDELRAAWEAAR